MSLRTKIHEAALEFTYGVLRAIARAKIEDLQAEAAAAAPSAPRPVPLARAARAEVVTQGAAPSAAPAARPDGPKRSGRPYGTVKASTAETTNKIVLHLRAHPGTTAEATRATLGIPKNQWSACVARALNDGHVRKEGTLRSTKYWAV
jgi:hypothetical protein